MLKEITAAGALALVLAGCATSAPPPDTTRTSAGRTPAAPAPRPATASVALSPEQAALIRAYFGLELSGGKSHGRNGSLPPGIAKNLARGKPLPPGIAKKHVPSELLVRLPPLELGYEYLVVAGKLLLVEAATQQIRAVLLESVFG